MNMAVMKIATLNYTSNYCYLLATTYNINNTGQYVVLYKKKENVELYQPYKSLGKY